MNVLQNISVKDFGPIHDAEISISPLTVFVGKNSSGKSFLASLIHSLSNPFNNNSHRFPSHSLNYLIENNPGLFRDFEDKWGEYLKLKPTFGDETFIYPLGDFIQLINEGFGKSYIKLIENELKSNWKTNLNNLNRLKKFPFGIKFNEIVFTNEEGRLALHDFSNKIENLIRTINFINPFGIKVSTDDMNLKINLDYSLWMKMYGDEDEISIAQLIYVLIVNKLINELKVNSFYIPASGDIFKDLNNYILDELAGVIDSSSIQKEVLTNLLKVNDGSQKGYFYDLACELENEISNGEIQIKTGDLKDEIVFIDN